MRDRRLSKRIPSILEGRLKLDLQGPQIPCTIRDLSATGARIWLPAAIQFPEEFELEIPMLEQAVRVRALWSRDREHGLLFLETLREPAGDSGRDLLGKIQRLDQGT